MPEGYRQEESDNKIAHRLALGATPVPTRSEIDGPQGQAQIVSILLAKGANPLVRNWCGETPLECAIKSKNSVAAFIAVYICNV